MKIKDKKELEFKLTTVILDFIRENKDIQIQNISVSHDLIYEHVDYRDGLEDFVLTNLGSSKVKISI